MSMRDGPTMDAQQLALWVERMRRPQDEPKQHRVPGKAITLRREQRPQPPERPATACQHHWVIDEPSGPMVHGVCKKCGHERDYEVCPPELNTSLTVKPGNRRW